MADIAIPAANASRFGEPRPEADELATVTAVATFRGQPGEGASGFVTPGTVLVVERTRAADLRANNLVRDTGLQTVAIETFALPAAAAAVPQPAAPAPGFIGTQPPVSGVRDTVPRAARTVTVGPATPSKKEKA